MPLALDKLCQWYDNAARPLPWRVQPPNPYHILVSEIMSQQSTMLTVLPYFERWLKKFPSPEILAKAQDDEVVAAWAGLGYYSRARNLLKSVRALVAQGAPKSWPLNLADWLALPGVGPYTAAAVTSISFDAPVIPVDGNVLRVSSRLFAIPDPLNSSAHRQEIDLLIQKLALEVPVGLRGKVAQAFMELGAQICRPQASQTLCELCPLAESCQARVLDAVGEFPKPKIRDLAQNKRQLAVVYENGKREVLLRRIPVGQRLEGQWELPLMTLEHNAETKQEVAKIADVFELWGPVKHSITKYRFEVFGVGAGRWEGQLPAGHNFVAPKLILDAHGTRPSQVCTTLTRKVLSKRPLFG